MSNQTTCRHLKSSDAHDGQKSFLFQAENRCQFYLCIMGSIQQTISGWTSRCVARLQRVTSHPRGSRVSLRLQPFRFEIHLNKYVILAEEKKQLLQKDTIYHGCKRSTTGSSLTTSSSGWSPEGLADFTTSGNRLASAHPFAASRLPWKTSVVKN